MSEVIRGYEIIGEWHQANEGVWAECQKGGKSYFIKKYDKIATEPDAGKIGTMFSERAYNDHLERFNTFKNRRGRINTQLKTTSGAGGSIVIPLESFIHEHCYTEVSNFYGDMLSEEEIIALPMAEKTTLLTSLTRTLQGVHALGIVHGDVKATNVVCIKNSLNKYVMKLIDFGASYFTDDKLTDPEEYSGDQNYASPELGVVWMTVEAEVEPEEYIEKLSTKSDIFSLGLMFHMILCGQRPKYVDIDIKSEFGPDREEKNTYPFEVMLRGGKMEVSSAITEEKYRNAITAMLSMDPNDRPDAGEVLRMIRDNRGGTTGGGSTGGGSIGGGTTGGISTGGGATRGGSTGGVTPPPPPPPPTTVDEPWPEDDFVWVDNVKDLLKSKNIIKLQRHQNFMKQKDYALFDRSSAVKYMKKADLIREGLAAGKPINDDVLRPEDRDRYSVNTELLAEKNIAIRPGERRNAITGRMVQGYEIMDRNTGSSYVKEVSYLVQQKYLIEK